MLYYKYDLNNLFTGSGVVKYSPKTGEALLPSNSTLIPVPDFTGGWVWNNIANRWDALSLETAKANKLALVQIEKIRARDAGFLVNGILFDSDYEARVAYLEIENKFSVDNTFTVQWKASDGIWVTMNAALYDKVKVAGIEHIHNCFLWQAAKEAAIMSANSIAELDAISVNYPD